MRYYTVPSDPYQYLWSESEDCLTNETTRETIRPGDERELVVHVAPNEPTRFEIDGINVPAAILGRLLEMSGWHRVGAMENAFVVFRRSRGRLDRPEPINSISFLATDLELNEFQNAGYTSDGGTISVAPVRSSPKRDGASRQRSGGPGFGAKAQAGYELAMIRKAARKYLQDSMDLGHNPHDTHAHIAMSYHNRTPIALARYSVDDVHSTKKTNLPVSAEEIAMSRGNRRELERMLQVTAQALARLDETPDPEEMEIGTVLRWTVVYPERPRTEVDPRPEYTTIGLKIGPDQWYTTARQDYRKVITSEALREIFLGETRAEVVRVERASAWETLTADETPDNDPTAAATEDQNSEASAA